MLLLLLLLVAVSVLPKGALVVVEVGAAAVVGGSANLLRGLGLPDCHHCFHRSDEAHALSHVFWIEEGVAVVAMELQDTLAFARLHSMSVSISSWSSATCVCFSRIQSLCSVRD